MITVLSTEDMRKSDAACIAAGTPATELMARAGRAIFEAGWGSLAPEELERRSPVAIVCGSGNNGGDGYVLALELHRAGIPCRIFLLKEKFSADGLYYFEKCKEAGVPWELCSENTEFTGFGTIADCIFGTGFKGRPEGLAARIIGKINEVRDSSMGLGEGSKGGANIRSEGCTKGSTYIVSADINSGLDAGSGMGEIFVRSDLTVSIGSFKPGHFLNMAKDAMAAKVNADIKIPPQGEIYKLLEASDISGAFRTRHNLSNKGNYGYVALIGGSLPYSGAIRLASMGNRGAAEKLSALGNAAMRAGAGVASIAVPASICPIIASSILEPTLIPLSDRDGQLKFIEEEFAAICRRYKLIAFGMGVGSSPDTQRAVEYLIDHYDGTLILDADGLNALARIDAERVSKRAQRLRPEAGQAPKGALKIKPEAEQAPERALRAKQNTAPQLILTPHLGEFARLSGCSIAEIQADPIERTKELARKYNAVVLQKGPASIISDGDAVYIADRGCPGMATAGSGDVLSGIMAALCYGARADENTSHEEGPHRMAFAAACAAWINGAAGELAQSRHSAVTMTAGDTASCVAEVIEGIL